MTRKTRSRLLATGGTSLRYDRPWSVHLQLEDTQGCDPGGQCYTVTMTADDSSSITAYFKLK